MSAALHVSQGHYREETAHMQTSSSGIEAYVTGNRFFQQLAAGGSIGALLDKTTLLKDVKNVSQTSSLRIQIRRTE